MTLRHLASDPLPPPSLPWFLQEPRIYEEAAPLVTAVQTILFQQDPNLCTGTLTHDALTLIWWKPPPFAFLTNDGMLSGAAVRWHDRLVLLCTVDLQCWAYHPGAAWQEALYCLAAPTWTGNAMVPGACCTLVQKGKGDDISV